MKRILQYTAAVWLMLLISIQQYPARAQYYDYNDYDGYGGITYQTFYDELSPYGRWIEYPEHGYVWLPDAGPGFHPYSTNGYWVWTNAYGWMWLSGYRWGWAVFHYGRWFYDPFYGWLWVPGYEWSPAWVVWRHGGDFYGWAPLRPGIQINISFSIGRYSPPIDYWCFAPRRYITSPNLYNYYIDRSRNVTIINQTTIINNYNYQRNVFITGPSRHEAERYTGRVTPVRFRESSRPGPSEFRNNEVVVFKPRVQKEDNRRFAPQRVERFKQQPDMTDRKMDKNKWPVPEEKEKADRNNRRQEEPFFPPGNRKRNQMENSTPGKRFEPNRPRQEQGNIPIFERKEPQVIQPDNQNNRRNDFRKPENQNSVREFSGRNNVPAQNPRPESKIDNQRRERPFMAQQNRNDWGNDNASRQHPVMRQMNRPQPEPRKPESPPLGNPGQKSQDNRFGDRGGKRKG
jgi:hypothetical protein